jgi:CubicO group peptidase (beta-lactamase class C family)
MFPVPLDLVSPEEAGVDPGRLDLFLSRVRLEVDRGPLPSAQVAVARGGRLVAFETYGDARAEKRYILQSVGRTVVAATVWKLLGEGLLDVSERVGDIIPEFATNDKDVVTVQQVLTHTAGFPFAPLGYPKMLDRDKRLAAFARWRLDWEPGSQLQFHLTGAAWGPWYLANADVLAAGEPSHSMVASAADMALFFQALRHSGLWKPNIVDEATRIHVSAQPAGDRLYGGSDEVANLGLFCMVSGRVGGSWTPRTGSPRTFGNGGAPCQLAFMDPETDTSFAFLTNGYPLSGYDYSSTGVNRIINIGNLGNDLIA